MPKSIGIHITFSIVKAPKYKMEVRLIKMKTASQKTAITVLTRLSKRSSRNWGMVKIFFSKKIGMKNFATRISPRAAIHS